MDYRKSLLLFLEKQEYSPSLSFADIKPWIKKSKITDFDLSHLLINMSSERENLIQGCGIVWMRCFIPLPNGKLNKISETDFLFKITPNGQKWIDEIQIRKKLLFDKRISRISVGIAISSLLLSIWIWNKADSMKAEMTKQTTRVDTLSLELQTYKDALSKMKWEFSLVDSGRNPKINKSDSLSHHP